MKIKFFSTKQKILLASLALSLKPQRQFWVHPMNKLRPRLGDEIKLDLKFKKYPDKFKIETRFTPEQFSELLLLTEAALQKDPGRRGCISPRVRLYVTLKYLAHGTSIIQLAESFCLGQSTVTNIINETVRVLWDTLSPIFMAPPTTAEWEKISTEFYEMWNFPHCAGSLDGKHVIIQCPNKSASTFFNYKKTFSINLIALSDAHYRFIMIDVGEYGRKNDSSVFRESPFGKLLFDGKLNLPQSKLLPNSTIVAPYYLVADDASPLTENIMKPYPGHGLKKNERIFNYRLSRARRTVENAFGVMASRFRLFRRPIIGKPENIDYIVKAGCILHNFFRTWDLKHYASNYIQDDTVDIEDTQNHILKTGTWRKGLNGCLTPMKIKIGSNNYSKLARLLRENLTTYFVKQDIVPWQDNYVQFAKWNPVVE